MIAMSNNDEIYRQMIEHVKTLVRTSSVEMTERRLQYDGNASVGSRKQMISAPISAALVTNSWVR